MTELFHRVRWTNLARALALLLALVVALFLLRGKDRAPALPATLTEPPAAVAEADVPAPPEGEATLSDLPLEDPDPGTEARRREAATRKAAHRRAAKRAAARRAAQRRRTAARRRAASRSAHEARARRGADRPAPGLEAPVAPAWAPSPAPAPGAEFRP
jgi:hypothetical protein